MLTRRRFVAGAASMAAPTSLLLPLPAMAKGPVRRAHVVTAFDNSGSMYTTHLRIASVLQAWANAMESAEIEDCFAHAGFDEILFQAFFWNTGIEWFITDITIPRQNPRPALAAIAAIIRAKAANPGYCPTCGTDTWLAMETGLQTLRPHSNHDVLNIVTDDDSGRNGLAISGETSMHAFKEGITINALIVGNTAALGGLFYKVANNFVKTADNFATMEQAWTQKFQRDMGIT